ncbi:MAG: protein translocase subunit SecD [Dehalococcoidia bacterium]
MLILRRWWNTLLFLAIIAVTALCVVAVWPSEPDRYLPDFINWPEGKGITLKYPAVSGDQFTLKTITRREMSLGLDLRGGTRLVLEPEPGVQVADLDAALDGARDVIERRVNEFGIAESEVRRLGDTRLDVELPGITAEEAIDKVGRTARLQFCEPILNNTGDIAVVRTASPDATATVSYEPQSCNPVRDDAGNIVISGPDAASATIAYEAWDQQVRTYAEDDIVWQPAKGDLDGVETELTGDFLRTTFVTARDQLGVEQVLAFEMNGDGAQILGSVTERLVTRNYPMAFFLDGQPITGEDTTIIAPAIQSKLTSSGIVEGLTTKDAKNLSKLLNIGSFPVPLRVVQQQNVDATLGETAVRDSVIAGEVALLLIMAFMILYYRLPGLMASLALVVYTSFVLMVFKLLPVTLTLSGVAAFVLSVGMAVDANILIFERMKEELRVGRNLISSLEDGFTRAWSSIRDSNISTLITCAILYWFGNQFGESAIKGFAITLSIGVIVSMFSAITVTRTFMTFAIRIRPLSRHLWLYVPDLPEGMHGGPARAAAVSGGSGTEPPRREGRAR